MEKQKTITPSILRVALATAALLMVPALAMQFTDEVDWKVGDFIIMGVLIFGIGLSYVLISRFGSSLIYKAGVALALCTTFLMIWANLAVGLIGAGPHWGNLMYIGVVAVCIIGVISSHFSTAGMERAMYVTASTLVLVAIIALSANMHEYPGSSVAEIIGVNGFFATLYAISGAFFRYLTLEKSAKE
ncbi:hypothetical protein C900_02596 [Fulvivirga imtechensis AK7]|uniref:Uncharacterized protein n=1 Tax=Fulvivirga imtechensis AK7 TaxID=1237149 RepID=L8JTG6_9BACT|nr:hypothetical protein [Fulvivirga imtechensis]ELR71533.1 hypothetical protein C900_02596 [Fulvivirga imtechensis AK7]